MDEIGALTPGVEFDFDKIIGAAGYTSLIIRGVRDLHGTTTGVYIDDARVPPHGAIPSCVRSPGRSISTASKCCGAPKASVWDRVRSGVRSGSS